MTSPINVGLIGHGKMGKLIEDLSVKKNIKIHAIKNSKTKFCKTIFSECQVIIDFSHPSATLENIEQAINLKKNIVIGTTGWYDSIEKAKKLVNESEIGLLYSPNFSIGVMIFCKIVSHASSLIDCFDDYDISGLESHHNEKIDIPSGTAKALGNILLSHIKRKKRMIYGNETYVKDGIHFPSIRSGNDPGRHEIQFDSDSDTITLSHSARNRESFAYGALQAAQWICNKKGFFTLDDLLIEIFDGRTQ